MTGRCKDCRSWEISKHGLADKNVCVKITNSFYVTEPMIEVVVNDENGLKVWTAPEFGCVLWVGREP